MIQVTPPELTSSLLAACSSAKKAALPVPPMMAIAESVLNASEFYLRYDYWRAPGWTAIR